MPTLVQSELPRVRLTVAGKEAVLQLYDNITSRGFLQQLPLSLQLSDYAQTEKIAYLPIRPATRGAPPGFAPSAGDVTYYAPWGNLAIFYKDFGFASGLISLGVVESGLDELASLSHKHSVHLELIMASTQARQPSRA